jgi:thiosulfate reductase cytochrome b subunit
MSAEYKKKIHDFYAPYWAAGIVILGSIGLSTIWLRLGEFWSGYVLDMTGPSWNYILFRGLFTSWVDNRWRRFFTPTRTVTIFLFVCFGIEAAQYYELYDSTFDPLDLIAYVSILIPLFVLDSLQNRKMNGPIKH